MEYRNSGTIDFLAGLLMGGIVGVAIGLVVAPESGEMTIARLRKEGKKLVKKSLDVMDEFEKEQVEPVVDKVTNQIKTKVTDMRAGVKAAL